MTKDSPNFKVIVVGAGIGGIACAVECKRKGYDVSMYDAASSFARLGDTIGVYILPYRCLSVGFPTVRSSYIDGLRIWIVN
jgi:2-polyprenyl-6-methoxyphenol hydroxylase-like FAD-dependent oxidoreductase